MSRDWDSLNTFADWAAVLNELLGKARNAIQSNNTDRQVDVQEELSTFIAKSPDHIAAELDAMARETMRDIFLTGTEKALESIANRTADLATHIKTVEAVTKEAQQAAKSIRLERATAVLNMATDTVRSLGELRQVLDDNPDDKAVADKIDKAVKVIQEVVPLVMSVKSST